MEEGIGSEPCYVRNSGERGGGRRLPIEGTRGARIDDAVLRWSPGQQWLPGHSPPEDAAGVLYCTVLEAARLTRRKRRMNFGYFRGHTSVIWRDWAGSARSEWATESPPDTCTGMPPSPPSSSRECAAYSREPPSRHPLDSSFTSCPPESPLQYCMSQEDRHTLNLIARTSTSKPSNSDGLSASSTEKNIAPVFIFIFYASSSSAPFLPLQEHQNPSRVIIYDMSFSKPFSI